MHQRELLHQVVPESLQTLRVKWESVDYTGPYKADSLYGYPVKWGKSTNMEAITHSFLGPLMQKSAVGAFKTLDALDFSIEHLSLYERRWGFVGIYPAVESAHAKLKNKARSSGLSAPAGSG
jgi:hypothetical protein